MTINDFLDLVSENRSVFGWSRNGTALIYQMADFYDSPSSRAIDVSNAAEVYRRLEALDPVNVIRYDDGRVWIKLYADHNRFSPAVRGAIKIHRELEESAILDEDGWSDYRDAYVADHVHEHVTAATELLAAGDAAAIERASSVTVDAEALLANPDRDAAITELAEALAETEFCA